VELTRRGLFQAGAAAVALYALPRGSAARAADSPFYSMAMHVHGSSSEGPASWATQVASAKAAGVDVLWASDHDWRMSAYQFPTVVPVTKPSSPGFAAKNGSVTFSTAGMQLGNAVAVFQAPRKQGEGNMANLTIYIDVVLGAGESLACVVVGSKCPAAPNGSTARLQFTTSGSYSWQPSQQVAGMSSDSAFSQLRIEGSGLVRSFRFDWGVTGDEPLMAQVQVLDTLRAANPGLSICQALEVSLFDPHINWFGGTLTLPDYASLPKNADDATHAISDMIRARGGIMSYNHMYGSHGNPVVTQQKELDVASSVIAKRAYGAAILEVGYIRRAGATLRQHMHVWDICTRNGFYLAGNGVSDNHTGGDWWQGNNTFATCAWATSPRKADLLSAISARRLFGRKLGGGWNGWVDLAADGALMGTVSPSSGSRTVQVRVSAVPTGGSVTVLQVPIDYAGVRVTKPAVLATYRTTNVDSAVTVPSGNAVRVVLHNSGGQAVGFSNPIWMPAA